MKNRGYDLTQGSILSKLLLIAAPVMATQLFQMAYNLIDMFFLGRISSDAVAAAGSAGMYIWLSVAFFIIGSMGAEIGVSQNMGRGDVSIAKKYAQNALLVAIVLGTMFAVFVLVFSDFLISLIQLREVEVAQDAVLYLMIVGASFPFLFVNNAITGIFNGLGNSKFPFYVKSIGLIFNVIISPIFIFTMELGIAGAAIATSIGYTVTGLLLLLSLKHRKFCPFEDFSFKDVFKPNWEIIKQIFKWSLPVSIESASFTMLTMIIVGFVAGFGADALAAQRVATQIESLTWLIGGGYAAAFTSFIGQNYGAKRWDRIKEGFMISAVVKSIWGFAVGIIMFFGGEWIFRLFIDEPEIVAIGVSYMRIIAIVQIPACMEALSAGAFRGVGKTLPPSIVSTVFNALRVVVAFWLSRTALGLDGIWIGIAFGNLMRGVVLSIWYVISSKCSGSDELLEDYNE